MPEEPNYLSLAFKSQYNLITLGTAIGFALLSANPLPVLLVLGAQMIVLPLVAGSERYQRAIKAKLMEDERQQKQASRRLEASEMLRALSDQERHRYRGLETLAAEIRENYQGLDASSQSLLDEVVSKLDFLIAFYLRMRYSVARYEAYFQTDGPRAHPPPPELARAGDEPGAGARTRDQGQDGERPREAHGALREGPGEPPARGRPDGDGARGPAATPGPELLHARPQDDHGAARRPRHLGGGDGARGQGPRGAPRRRPGPLPVRGPHRRPRGGDGGPGFGRFLPGQDRGRSQPSSERAPSPTPVRVPPPPPPSGAPPNRKKVAN